MRSLAALFLIGSCLPGFAATKVSVRQLEQMLSTVQHKADAEVASQLSGLELTERLSTPRLAELNGALRGNVARQTLIALADASAFLDPPSIEIPAVAKPEMAAQHEFLALAANYVIKTIHRMPNFLATRDTIRFQDGAAANDRARSMIDVDPRFHFVENSSATVLYRDGREIAKEIYVRRSGKRPFSNGLNAWGVFGPLLGTVMVDALRGKVTWSHWERGAAGPLAVFHYQVLAEKSHYEVKYGNPFEDWHGGFDHDPGFFDEIPGYHGEIAVDPASGTVLRLVLQTELQPARALVRADVLVEYGPVEIGGKVFVCPLKSVSISSSVTSRTEENSSNTVSAIRPRITAVNDVVFKQYHQFRSESRIFSEDHAVLDRTSPVSNDAVTPFPNPKDQTKH